MKRPESANRERSNCVARKITRKAGTELNIIDKVCAYGPSRIFHRTVVIYYIALHRVF